MDRSIRDSIDVQQESLYIDTAEAESVEMYLKAIWYIREEGEDVVLVYCQIIECKATFCGSDAT